MLYAFFSERVTLRKHLEFATLFLKPSPSQKRAVVVSENALVVRLQCSIGVACLIHEFIHNSLVEKYIKIVECLLEG